LETSNIRQLIEKYFNGQTSVEEEKLLQQYFASGDIEEDLVDYKSFFHHFSSFSKVELDQSFDQKIKQKIKEERKQLFLLQPWMLKVAAVLILAAGFGLGYMTKDIKDDNALQAAAEKVQALHAMNLLEQESAHERLQGLSIARNLTKPDEQLINRLLETLNHDDNTNIRLSAVQTLSSYTNQQDIRKLLIRSIAQQYSALIQLTILESIPSTADSETKKQLQAVLQQPDISPEVKQLILKKL
jgi:hypothetical protein